MSLLLLFNQRLLPFTALPSAGLLLQSVITLSGESDEGDLVQAVAPPWFEIAKLFEKDPAAALAIDPRKLEELIAGWYKEYGFDEVTLTPRSGDFGRDVIAVKRGVLSVRIIDSVKRYAPDRRVSADDVRSLLGVLSGDRQATKGVVTTTSEFAPGISSDPFIAPFVPYRLELVDGAELRRRLADIASMKRS